jgi:hypothetical protein
MFGTAILNAFMFHRISRFTHKYFSSGSNDAWRQHPWLKAKHNIRYMCMLFPSSPIHRN